MTQEQKSRLAAMVETDETIKQIARELGMSHNTLLQRMAASGLRVRRVLIDVNTGRPYRDVAEDQAAA